MPIDPKTKLVPLDEVEHESEMMILGDFSAIVDGREAWVTAVLERTAVIEPAPGEPKLLVNRHRCLVDPSQLRFGLIAARYAARRGREAARRNRAAAAQEKAA